MMGLVSKLLRVLLRDVSYLIEEAERVAARYCSEFGVGDREG